MRSFWLWFGVGCFELSFGSYVFYSACVFLSSSFVLARHFLEPPPSLDLAVLARIDKQRKGPTLLPSVKMKKQTNEITKAKKKQIGVIEGVEFFLAHVLSLTSTPAEFRVLSGALVRFSRGPVLIFGASPPAFSGGSVARQKTELRQKQKTK